ncbi:hypothetical protein DCAR_0312165 [Daucus carota subsp. sativus]|uniref:Bifunctional inhibitor/plant lipid transfer protein/seed storage helical domain-containing protein n=1 Tax=Daucus carota subsp. sativus TaxID=79200 RepID=A0AAF0WR14_DAUCS|nr:hypothetical protein DCAR_0312165 [Daucus carota subsp. sativus]
MSKSGTINKSLIAAIALAVMIAQVNLAVAVNCNIASLAPCLPVILNPSLQPTAECCTNLVAQEPCFCIFIKDPRFKGYVNSPGAKKLQAACGVQPPKCS